MSATTAGEIWDQRVTPERRSGGKDRVASLAATDRAGSGQRGIALGLAGVARVLRRHFLKFDAADPGWPDRDRLVVSIGRGAVVRELFRDRAEAGGAGWNLVKGRAGVVIGPPGQGAATAVGMALAERILAARFGRSLVDHRTWVIASRASLMKGVSHEAAEIAVRFKLARLTVLYAERDDDSGAAPSPRDDPLAYFAAIGWASKRVNAQDPSEIAGALSFALRSRRPTVISCRTGSRSGEGHPRAAMADPIEGVGGRTHVPHPSVASEAIVGPPEEGEGRGASARRGWLRRLNHHALRAEFERVTEGQVPERLGGIIADLGRAFARGRSDLTTESASRAILATLTPHMHELVGGSVDPLESGGHKEGLAGSGPSSAPCAFHYGAREHAMAGAMNGLARHGGVIPYGRAPLAASDYMLPALRLAAASRTRAIYVFHDAGGGGGDPTSPGVDLAGLRALANFFLFRPADAAEAAECWALALARRDGPSALVVTDRATPLARARTGENPCGRGGYVVVPAPRLQRGTLIASGPEVAIAMRARDLLATQGIGVAVVSLPCWKLFEREGARYQNMVLGSTLRVGIEASGRFGWDRWLGTEGVFIGVQDAGACAPSRTFSRYLGITPEDVVAAVKQRIS